ncbi:GrpE protein [Xylanimonas cellulosilytica DSM 15894]|uniref:Protein GrpE n=1 Tax=Xylanimonas cellulosilytica (strain DSM 15894 / JCM 12276 / CECT 5975 / KCTC 9989 / LMG 20990 / NBRC 107835 / XIL07) TaxID=446471 RepID=D1BUK0_XYLCX|nr:nucleotide exchange factor GrpE [Xylanimonas cellulosilytica]ACZ29241.1 GrpE protein [Xylanimonas cellulosilytica DSM 15894]
MTDEPQRTPGNEEDKPFSFTDKRKVDPTSGAPRVPEETADAGAGTGAAHEGAPASGAADADPLAGLDFEPSAETAELEKAKADAADHLDALQRERASFTNYRNRALRDQEAARTRGLEDVLTALLPVLDDIERAKSHAELVGPMAAIAEKLDASLAKFGIERFGAVGEVFDPTQHEALMHRETDTVTEPTIELVVEPGYRIGERIVRAARVGVVGPE